MLGLAVSAVVGLTAFNLYVVINGYRQQVGGNLQRVSQMLAQSKFPLTETVLSDMKTLSGADFVVFNSTNNRTNSSLSLLSNEAIAGLKLLQQSQDQASHIDLEAGRLNQEVEIQGQRYFHSITVRRIPQLISSGLPNSVASGSLRATDSIANQITIHVLYSQADYNQLWWQNLGPPLLGGLLALPLVTAVCTLLAATFTRPLSRLKTQVELIADGKWNLLKLPQRDDEVRELSEAVNRMVEQLRSFETEVRQKERLQTMVHLGSGMAHKLRNSATGCRMAIQLCQSARDDDPKTEENLSVAIRQLSLMDKYIQRFLSLDEPGARQAVTNCSDWVPILREMSELLSPAAKHLGLHLQLKITAENAWVRASVDDLEQIAMNLLNNALEAASEPGLPPAEEPNTLTASRDGENHYVAVELHCDLTFAYLTVEDSGPGPPQSVQDSIFNSFVTHKPNGVGLGLYLTQQLVQEHQGTIQWERIDPPNSATRFQVRLPLSETFPP